MCVSHLTKNSPVQAEELEPTRFTKNVLAVDWRSEAAQKTSDRVICVTGSESHVTASFPVHELFLTGGERKSAYFASLYQCMRLSKDASSLIVVPVTLKERAAALFPHFLDFVYSSSGFCITTETVVGLRYLAESFKNSKLLEETWRFIKKDMGVSNFELYLRDALYFEDKQTATWVAYGCTEHITLLSPSSPILQMMVPDDFQQIISLARLCSMNCPLHCSELVAAYCACHIKDVDERWFREVTKSENLPIISPKAALNLMEAEFQIKQEASPNTGCPMLISSIQKRCVMALSSTYS